MFNKNFWLITPVSYTHLDVYKRQLHHYEPQLNKRIKSFLGVDGGDLYDTDRFLDIKLSCREQMLPKLMDYDPAKGAEYATYIFPFIRDATVSYTHLGGSGWYQYLDWSSCLFLARYAPELSPHRQIGRAHV